MTPGGGFEGRGGEPDLYYSVFGIDCLLATGSRPPEERLREYLGAFGKGDSLDLMHLSCLARCWGRMLTGPGAGVPEGILARIEEFRSADGGYNSTRDSPHGSIYGAFLACSAYEELGHYTPAPDGVVSSVRALQRADGCFTGEREIDLVTTNACVGAVLLLQACGETPPESAIAWLQNQHFDGVGGFRAAPAAPIPDLVSTATALFTLRNCAALPGGIREPCAAFVQSLRHEDGGFAGHWMDDDADCEHTFYGLLSLGCLVE